MIEIEDKIVSSELFEQCFSCDLSKCKGVCCVEGDSGAPLEIEEVDILENEIDIIKKYMGPEGIAAVNQQGVFVVDSDGDYTTTLIEGGPCVYTIQQGGSTWCAIEKAYIDGKITFRKPISCHLYPIRVARFSNGYTGLNYHRWDICHDALCKGKMEGTPLYKSLKEPLERAFGAPFYQMLEEAERLLIEHKTEDSL